MIWNTIAHPKMMDDESGGGENNTPIFSEEALAPLFKHMNRALLSTFDVIVMAAEYSTDDDLISKQIPLLGDFDTVYRAAKSGALLNVMYVVKSLMLDQDGILQPDNGSPLSLFSGLLIPIVLEGKYENGLNNTIINTNDPIDFKDDRFVYIRTRNFGLIFSSAGEIYDAGIWFNDFFPKYRVVTNPDAVGDGSSAG